MEYSENTYSDLYKEIASLSLDPYPLTHEDLTEIIEIIALLKITAQSKSQDEAFRSILQESEDELSRKYSTELLIRKNLKKKLTDIYDSILSAFTDFLSTPPLNEAMTVWFSALTEEKRNTLEKAILSFTSHAIEVQTRLISLKYSEDTSVVTVKTRKELLRKKIALLLSFPNEKERIEKEIDRLSSLTKKIESLGKLREQLEENALRVAIELLPPFLEKLHPALIPSSENPFSFKDATDVRRLFLAAEGLREQIREALNVKK